MTRQIIEDGRINTSTGIRLHPEALRRIRKRAADLEQSIALTIGKLIEAEVLGDQGSHAE